MTPSHVRIRATHATVAVDENAMPGDSAAAAAALSGTDVDEKQRKRLKHREYVKKSYQKKISTIHALKSELTELETEYSKLLLSRTSDAIDTNPGTTGTSSSRHQQHKPSTHPQPTLMRKYVELADLKAAFQKENAELYELRAEFMKTESRVQQLLDAEASYPFDTTGSGTASASTSPHRTHADLLQQRQEQHQQKQQHRRFHFTSLPGATYAQIIAHARDDILKFVADTDKLSTGTRVFGWTDQRKIAGEELKFALEKQFPTISAYDLLARSWPIFSSPERFSKVYGSSLKTQFTPLQHINNDTILFYRTVQVVGSDTVAKTVFLLARLRIEQGYMLLFKSIDRDLVHFRESDEGTESAESESDGYSDVTVAPPHKEVWVTKYTWVIFHELGPESCLFHFGGSTLTNLWLKEVLFIALRWETMAVGPQITLEL